MQFYYKYLAFLKNLKELGFHSFDYIHIMYLVITHIHLKYLAVYLYNSVLDHFNVLPNNLRLIIVGDFFSTIFNRIKYCNLNFLDFWFSTDLHVSGVKDHIKHIYTKCLSVRVPV